MSRKFEENTSTLCCLKIFSNLNAGAPIGIPNALASLLLDIAQSSLFDNTTTGFFSRLGLKLFHMKHKSYYNLQVQTLA